MIAIQALSAAALADAVLYSQSVKPPEEYIAAMGAEAEPSVAVVYDMKAILSQDDDVVLQGVLNGFDGVDIDLQWQYNTGRDDDGDGVPDGWRNAEGDSKGITYQMKATREALSAQWQLVVTEVTPSAANP